MRVYPEFLKNLPGVQASDSMAYRIEALRVYLEGHIGDQALKAVYQSLNSNNDDEEDVIEGLLGAKKMKFILAVNIIFNGFFYQK